MIVVHGTEGTDEFDVASAIAMALEHYWPGITHSPAEKDLIKIAANTKISGYPVSDIDVVLAARFESPRFFIPSKPIKDDQGQIVHRSKVQVTNFAAVIEVKAHPASKVRVINDSVEVLYKDGWKNATEQNIKQAHSFSEYLDDQWIKAWVHRCLALHGLQELPRYSGKEQPGAGAVAHGFTAAQLLTAIFGVDGVNHWKGRYSARRSCAPEAFEKVLVASVFTPVIPTNLDRLRMARIAARPTDARELAPRLGTERLHLSGHGGTGKTVFALQVAAEAFESHGKRTLVATYNTALAADITRMLSLMGIPGSSEGGGVDVRTTMSIVYSWLHRLGVTNAEEPQGFNAYERLCAEAIEMLRSNAIGQADLDNIRREFPERFDFDAVIIDEAQDLPQVEADLIALLFGPEKVSIADGREQLLRGRATDWRSPATSACRKEFRKLSRCLRMKRNLGAFANSVARGAGLNWSVDTNNEAAGGRVILYRGHFAASRDFRQRVRDIALGGGNKLVDSLFCVPPSDVINSQDGRRSKLGLVLEEDGHEIWDGVDPRARRDFPRSPDSCRVVQFGSCRGLEGWVTVLDGFDEFWELAKTDGQNAAATSGVSAITASQFAWQKALIPLTRPVDTLVVCLGNATSEASTLLARLARTNEDFVEWA